MKEKLFLSVILGFLLGNIMGSQILLSLYQTVFLVLLSTSVFIFLALRIKKYKKVFSDYFLIFSVCLLAFSLGIFRFSLSEQSLKLSELAIYGGQNIEMIGVVLNEPVRKTDLSKINIEVGAVTFENEVTKINKEKVSVHVDFFQPLSYGDVIIIQGKLEKIKNREENSNFDFEYYAKKDGIQYQMFRPKVMVQKNVGNSVVIKLKAFKDFFEGKLSEHLSEPHASLVSGMLIAGKGALPKDIQNEFIRTGLIHIVVLSGFNIAIIIKFLNSLFHLFRFNRKFSIFLILTSLFLFILMAGATPPVVRAVLMASIVLMGKMTFRKMDANKVLLFVAFILAIINPYSVPFDPSFQLSFLATFSIINLAPLLEKYFIFIRSNLFRETVSQTLAATIFVSPFVLYLMGNFSIIALLVNVIVLPFVPILMLFGFLLVVLSFIHLI